jgi:hypothetical protein
LAHDYATVVMQREDRSIEKVPGVNSLGKTREELRKNLRSAPEEAIEMDRPGQIDGEHASTEGASWLPVCRLRLAQIGRNP